MNAFNFLNMFFSNLILIPALIMCYLPFKNHLKYRTKPLFIGMSAIIVLLSALFSFITLTLDADKAFTFLLLVFILYFIYEQTLVADLAKSLAIYLWMCALMSIIINGVYGYDAIVNPASNSDTFNIETTFIRVTISFFIVAIFWSPLYDHGSNLVDMLTIPKIWIITMPVSIIFVAISLLIMPGKYSSLYVDDIFATFWGLLIVMFFVFIILTIIFYNIVFEIINSVKY